jgi:hypothetical protein
VELLLPEVAMKRVKGFIVKEGEGSAHSKDEEDPKG